MCTDYRKVLTVAVVAPPVVAGPVQRVAPGERPVEDYPQVRLRFTLLNQLTVEAAGNEEKENT